MDPLVGHGTFSMLFLIVPYCWSPSILSFQWCLMQPRKFLSGNISGWPDWYDYNYRLGFPPHSVSSTYDFYRKSSARLELGWIPKTFSIVCGKSKRTIRLRLASQTAGWIAFTSSAGCPPWLLSIDNPCQWFATWPLRPSVLTRIETWPQVSSFKFGSCVRVKTNGWWKCVSLEFDTTPFTSRFLFECSCYSGCL